MFVLGQVRSVEIPKKKLAMSEIYHNVSRWINSLDKQDWLLVLIGTVVVGFLCLQGLGSRKNY